MEVAGPPSRGGPDPSGSAVILVVEDDDGLRQLVMDSLQRHQHWVLSARTGEEAWALISEHSPIVSLLMVEVVLPDMDGLALAARARALAPDRPSRAVHGRRGPNSQRPCVRV